MVISVLIRRLSWKHLGLWHIWVTGWVRAVLAHGGVVSLDMGPNYNQEAGPIGTFATTQVIQVQSIARALGRSAPQAVRED